MLGSYYCMRSIPLRFRKGNRVEPPHDGHDGLLIVNPNTSTAITALIERQVRLALPKGIAAHTRTVSWGTPSIESRLDAAIATVSLLDTLTQAGHPKGVLVAAFGDPGLEEARELLDVPVVGIGEASLNEAAAAGGFAILTIQPASLPLVVDLVRRNNLENKCAGVQALPVSVLDAANPDAVRAELAALGRSISRNPKIRSIVLGGAPLGVHANYLSQVLGVRCIDPIEAGVKHLARIAVAKPNGHRRPTYALLARKDFKGTFSFIHHLNDRLRRHPSQ